MPSGYTPCPCRDCMEIATDGNLCDECRTSGCEGGNTECSAPHAYGGCFGSCGSCDPSDYSDESLMRVVVSD